MSSRRPDGAAIIPPETGQECPPKLNL